MKPIEPVREGRHHRRDRYALSPRELEILRLVAEGLSNQDIADKLIVEERTARHHVSRILAKLDLKNRTQATLYALRLGLVDNPVEVALSPFAQSIYLLISLHPDAWQELLDAGLVGADGQAAAREEA